MNRHTATSCRGRGLLGRLAALGYGLRPIEPDGLRLVTPPGLPDLPAEMVVSLKEAKSELRARITDTALAEAWPGIPVAGLTPTLRVLLAWYTAARETLFSSADSVERQAYMRDREALVKDGWPQWHAGVVALEPHLPGGRAPQRFETLGVT